MPAKCPHTKNNGKRLEVIKEYTYKYIKKGGMVIIMKDFFIQLLLDSSINLQTEAKKGNEEILTIQTTAVGTTQQQQLKFLC